MTTTAKDNFRDVLSEYIPENTAFYRNISRAYDIFSNVLEQAKKENGRVKHGVGLVILREDTVTSALEDALEDAEPYNGRPHSIYDHDIEQVVGDRCDLDGALLVETSGHIPYAGVEMQIGTSGYKRKYGIPVDVKMKDFMEFDDTEEPVGFRTRSALKTSDVFGDQVAILTLGESGEINLYYCGDRLYNSAGRQMHWELAERMPSTRSKVIPLRQAYQPKETPYSEPPLQAAAAGGLA